jgi:autotransporter-associated beta strand protein
MNPSISGKRRAAILASIIAALACWMPSSTQAASYTWGGSNSAWTNTSVSGWNGGPPANGDNATINSGVVTINGLTIGSAIAINSGGTLVAFADSSVGGNVSLNGNLTGSGSLNKAGNFSLFLAGNNSGFSGTVNATQSNLFLSADNSGSAAAAWVLSSGATLLNSPSQSGNRTYQLGSLAGTGGTLGNCLESGSGLVTFEIGGNDAGTTFAGLIANTVWNTGTTAITKVGDGTLKLTAVSTYTGGTLVNDGTLELNSTADDQSVIRGALTVNSGAAVNITGSDFAGLGRLNGANVTTLSVNGGTVNNSVQSWLTGATVNLTAGTMNGSGSHHLLNSSLNSKASAAASHISSNLVIRKDYGSSDLSIDTEDGAVATDLLISGNISQAGPAAGLFKTGAGTLVLTGAGTYDGLTSVNGGILQLGDGTSGHDGTLANTSGINIAGGASLVFNRFGDLTSGSPISGSGSVIKTGPGTQTLTGSNTYSGGTTVSGGTLVVESTSTLGSGNVTANAGAVIEIRNPAGAIANVASVHLNGTGKLTIEAGVTEIVGALYIDGVQQDVGYYDATSLATHLTGGGSLSVVNGTVPGPTPGSIPYQAALDAAAVNLPDVADISKKGLLVGNGELNAIVYSSGNEIRLRVSKNDCWDMRVNTSADPALPTVNAATQSFTGNQGSAPPSWTNYVHPTALPCTDIALAAAAGQTGWTSAKLDLAKASATVLSNTDSTTVRVLSQSNVILIDSGRAASLGGVSGLVNDHEGNPISGWVSAANPGTQGGYTYLHQNIPGDADVSGMDIYIVSGSSGTRRAIAVVTSRESSTPLADAMNLVTNTLADANAVATHEAAWEAFWSKSGVSLSDATLQNWWYRMVYFLRTFAKAGGNVIGLQAAFDTLGGWHNSLTLNYNAQQVYLAAGPINHPELIEPFVDVLQRNLNRAKWFAATSFPGSEGAYFHVNLWPFEPDPADCTTPNKHQHAYMPWGYTWGTAGHSASVLWDYYKFKPGTASIDRIYPVLEQFALFYCSMLEQCPLVGGKRRIGPSFFPEVGPYGQQNVCYDITFINCCLKAAREAATLKGDSVLANRIATLLAQMPTYSTTVDSTPNVNGTVTEHWLNSGLQSYDNHGAMAQAVFPGNEITHFSSEADKALFKRTIQRIENISIRANSNVTINVARARLGLGSEAIDHAKLVFGPDSPYSPEQPNGLFYWKLHGYYQSEQVCIARLVSELLLQSVGDVIRLFPAWPDGKDGRFSRLLAQGGFEVSAERTAGVIQNVTIKSTVGGDARVSNPWTGYALNVVAQSNGAAVASTETNGIHTFPTTVGETYQLTRGAATAPPSTPTGLHPYAGNTTASLGWNAAPGAESYLVSRSTDGVNFAVIGAATGTGYVDTGLTNGATYHYKVRAANTIGESPDSPAVSVQPGGVNAISINFQGGSAQNGTPAAMASTESAGHVSAGHWNTVPGAVGSASSLVQNNGSTSPAAVAWSSNNLWSTLVPDTAGNNRMMKGYLDTTDTSTTSVTVSGLPAGYTSGGYEVYLYVDGQSNATDNKQGRYTLDGSLITLVDAANTDFSGTFTLANNGTGNCIVFTNRTTSGFTLTATPNPLQPGGRAPLNGIQIVGSVAGAPPLAPATPAANALSSTSVRITWTDAAADETAYVVEHSPAGANTWTAGPQMPSNTTESVTSGLEQGTQYDFRIKALGTGGAATSATVTIATLTAYEQWKQDNGIALAGADDEDPDGDGMTNSQEYAFGTDPQEASSFQAITSLPTPATGTFTYTRRKVSITGLDYTVWTSTNLNDWAEDTNAIQTATDIPGSDNQSVEVQLSPALLTSGRLFVRVQAD